MHYATYGRSHFSARDTIKGIVNISARQYAQQREIKEIFRNRFFFFFFLQLSPGSVWVIYASFSKFLKYERYETEWDEKSFMLTHEIFMKNLETVRTGENCRKYRRCGCCCAIWTNIVYRQTEIFIILSLLFPWNAQVRCHFDDNAVDRYVFVSIESIEAIFRFNFL